MTTSLARSIRPSPPPPAVVTPRYHAYRVVCDRRPRECLRLACRSVHARATNAAGIEMANLVRVTGSCALHGHLVLRLSMPEGVAAPRLEEFLSSLPDAAAMAARGLPVDPREMDAAPLGTGSPTLRECIDGTISDGKVLLRLSVPCPEGSAPSYAPIVSFVKEAWRRESPPALPSFVVVGTMRHPSSVSVVLLVPGRFTGRLQKASGDVKVTDFSPDDLDKLGRQHAEAVAIALGSNLGEAAPRRAVVAPRPYSTSPVRSFLTAVVALHAVIAVAFLRILRVVSQMPGGEASSRRARPRVHAPTIWDLLLAETDDPDRVESARLRCEGFERVAAKRGDAASAETSSSVGGLLARMAAELHELKEVAGPEETSREAARLMDTVDRLAERAEQERVRLVSQVAMRLETTRRFVDAKLDHQGLVPLPAGRSAE